MVEAKLIITVILPVTIVALMLFGFLASVVGQRWQEEMWLLTLRREPNNGEVLLDEDLEETEEEEEGIDHLFDFSDCVGATCVSL